MSYAASTLLLSDIQQLPLFYRTVPSYTEYNIALYALMREFGWWNIAVIHKELPHHTLAVESLANYFDTRNEENGILRGGNSEGGNQEARIVSATGLNGFLDRRNAPEISTRIYVAMVPESEAGVLLCAAYLLGLTGEQYQWIFLGENYSKMPWKSNVNTDNTHRKLQCSMENLTAAAEAALFITHHQPVTTPEVSSTFSQKQIQFWNNFKQKVNTETEGQFQNQWSTRVMATYDAVWTIAFALEKVLKKADDEGETTSQSVSAGNNDLVGVKAKYYGRPISRAVAGFNAAMEKTDFEGLTSRIMFSSTAHSLQNPIAYILQLQSGELVPIGRHVATNDTTDLKFYGNKLRWIGTFLPRDRPLINLQVASIYVVCVMLGISILGIALSVIVLGINWIYRKHKVIKASSPYLNFVVITGCMLGFLSISFLSVENLDINYRIPNSAYYVLCNIRPFLLSISFTLSFGALFAKTFRIYLVFRDPWTRRRAAKDSKLFATIGVFLAYDILVAVLWVSISPLSLVRVLLNYNPAAFTEELYCYCAHVSSGAASVNFLAWIGLITVPKAVLLAFGIFLVIQTSKIKALFFKDAKYTGIAIFGVMIACGVGVPTAIFTMLFFQASIAYIVSTSTILTCSYLILIMVFVPKFLLLRKYRNRVPARVLIGLNPSFRVTRTTTTLHLYGTTIRNQRKARTTRNHYGKSTAQVHYDKSKQFRRAYTAAANLGQEPLPLSCQEDIVRMTFQKKPERVETLEDWWEPAFEENSSEQVNAEVHEAAVSFEGYQGIISVLKTRRTSDGSETSSCDSPITLRRSETERRTDSSCGSYLSTITEIDQLGTGGGDDASNSHMPYFHITSFSADDNTDSPVRTVDIARSKSFSFLRSSASKAK